MPVGEQLLMLTLIASSILTAAWLLALTTLMSGRKALGWKQYAALTSSALFAAVVIDAIALMFSLIGFTQILDALYFLSLVLIIIGFASAALIGRQLVGWQLFVVSQSRGTAEPIKKPKIERLKRTGIPALDQLLREPLPRSSFILMGPEGTHPWRMAQHFAADGLVKGEGVVYVAATRPPEAIIEQLGELFRKKYGRPLERFQAHFAIVDCFTPYASFKERDSFPQKADYEEAGWNYFQADPRDLNELHKALSAARNSIGEKTMRIVYDTFSSISEVVDHDSLYQFLLHNTAVEERFGYMSCYLLRHEESWLQYLVGGDIRLKLVEGERAIEILKMPAHFREGVFRLDAADRVTRRATKPKIGHEIGFEQLASSGST